MGGKDLIERLKTVDLKFMGSYRVELLGLAIMFVGAILFYNNIYKGEQKELAALNAQISAKEAELVSIKARNRAVAGLRSSIKDSTEKLEREKAMLESLKERLPSTRQISQLLAELSGERRGDRVTIRSIRPMAVEDKGELIRLPFQINLDAGFFSFGNYMERLENLERVMVIENFKLEAVDSKNAAESTDGHELTSQLYLSAYILGPVE